MLLAPAPQFAVSLLLVRPSLDWYELWFAFNLFAASYGLMVLAGLPLYLLLRTRGGSATTFVLALCLVAWFVVGLFTFAEGDPSPPLPGDNSPFAGMTLKGGGWLVIGALWTPFVILTGSLFMTLLHRHGERNRRDVSDAFE